MFGMEDIYIFFSQFGPFPLEDIWQVAEAFCVVWRLLDAGNNSQQVQFDTIQKICTFQSNYVHAGIDGTDPVFLGTDETSSRVSNSVTNLIWSSRFMQGCHKRMGGFKFP